MAEYKKKMDCWDFMRCGREPFGALVHHFGTCAAALDKRLDGVHGGKNGGRACWVIASDSVMPVTECCVFSRIHKGCANCDFYRTVKREEGSAFMTTEMIAARLSEA